MLTYYYHITKVVMLNISIFDPINFFLFFLVSLSLQYAIMLESGIYSMSIRNIDIYVVVTRSYQANCDFLSYSCQFILHNWDFYLGIVSLYHATTTFYPAVMSFYHTTATFYLAVVSLYHATVTFYPASESFYPVTPFVSWNCVKPN